MRNMSGVNGRLGGKGNGEELIVGGFNGKRSVATIKGINNDGKEEWFVEDMPDDLVLLCANEYARDGVVILFGDDGMVIRLQGDGERELRNWIEKYPVEKMLVVKNATYRVVEKGVIRAAVVQKGVISILRTSKYKGVSDGGDARQYVNVNGGIEKVIRDQIEGGLNCYLGFF